MSNFSKRCWGFAEEIVCAVGILLAVVVGITVSSCSQEKWEARYYEYGKQAGYHNEPIERANEINDMALKHHWSRGYYDGADAKKREVGK